MKTWRQLEELAARDHFHLYRTINDLGAGVTICEESGMREPLLSIVATGLDDRDADIVTRETVEAVLRALRNLDRDRNEVTHG